MSNSCIQDLAAFQVSIPCNTTWEWLFSPVSMEGNTGNFLSNEKQSLEVSTSDNEVKMPTENSGSTSVFVNHGKKEIIQDGKCSDHSLYGCIHSTFTRCGLVDDKNVEGERKCDSGSHESTVWNGLKKKTAIAWQENRKEWIGDQSQRSKRIQKDPIISELVDFLVDIWLDDGLYDLDNQ
ncbi:unnamed protein product [Camellia sinensis]